MKNRAATHTLSNWLHLCASCLLLLSGCTCGSRQENNPASAADSTKVVRAEKNAPPTDSLLVSPPVEPEHFDTTTQHWILGTLNKKQLSQGDFTLNQPDKETDGAPTTAPSGLAPDSAGEEGALGPATAFYQPNDYYSNYRSVIRWSPDSSHFVDFGSYGLVAVKHPDGTTSLEGGEPDTKVVLVDPKAKKQTQVLFGGPGIHVMDVHWLNGQTFLMLYSNAYASPADTILFLADVARQHSAQYHYTPVH